MNFPVTLFVIQFFFFQVQSATIPVNVGQNEGEGLEDLSQRLYLSDPYFQNTIVGATMKKNLKKLCAQCKNSPLCRGKDECEHCSKYCGAYGAETKGNMRMASSMEEEVGIAREPENDFMQNKDEKDATLVSRFADEGMMSKGMATGMEQEEHLQMPHEPLPEEMTEDELVMEHHREHGGQQEKILHQNHQASRYYTAGVINPGLLMNIMLKLINIKEASEIEKVIILVKSKKSVPVMLDNGDEIETEFLKMLGKELETSERIHGKSQLDSKDINKILESAYEKGDFKSKSQVKIVSEIDTIPMIYNEKISRIDHKIQEDIQSKSNSKIVSEADTPMIHNEKITRFDDKIVSSPNEMEITKEEIEGPSDNLEEIRDQYKSDGRIETSKTMLRESNMNLKNQDQNQNMMIASESLPEDINHLGSSNVEASKIGDMGRQEAIRSESMDNLETKHERQGEDSMEMNSDGDESLEENDNARTWHHKKHKKIKKKKEHKHTYSPSYGSYYNEPYGYYRSNDDLSTNYEQQQEALEMNHAGTLEAITGAQQESLRPLNEDRIGAKDDWQRDQKGYIFKGEGDLLRDLEKSPKTRNNDELIGAQQEGLRSLNKDRIGFKDDWQQEKKGFIFKGEGGLLRDLEKSQKTRNNDELIGAQQEGLRPLNEDLIGYKDDWQRDQKGFIIKGEGGLLKNLEKSQKTRNNDELIGTQLKVPKSHSGDGLDWQKNQEELIHKGQEISTKDLERSQETRLDETQKFENRVDDKEDFPRSSKGKIDYGIAQIILSEKNKKLDPKKVQIAEPNEDSHDGMADPFHNRIHAHFKKVQEYFNKHSGQSTGKSESRVGMAESTNTDEDVMIKARNNVENSDSTNVKQMNTITDNLQMTNSLETKGELLSKDELPDMSEQPIADTPKVGINFRPEDLINLQMMKESSMDDDPRNNNNVGINIQPQDLIILQKKKENNNFKGSTDLLKTHAETPKAKASAPTSNIIVTGDLNDLENPINGPQFVSGDENLPGQTIIQVDDQLIDVPDEGGSIFQVNSKPVIAVANENGQEQDNMFINQPVGDDGEADTDQNVGAMNVLTSENLRINPQVMKDHSGQNMGLSADMPVLKSESPRYPISLKNPLAPSYSFKKEHEFRAPKIVYTGNGDMQRSAVNEKPRFNVESEFPIPNKSPIKKHPFAPASEGFRAAKIIQTGEQNSITGKFDHMTEMSSTENIMKAVGDEHLEMIGGKQMAYENAIEEKIEKLITPREQEFLHNFGKIVPSIEKMHLNSKSDIYFMGNGIKLPLKMSPNNDGSISLSVDLEKLCKCKNSTCAHKIDIIHKLDGNLMDLSNNYENSEVSQTKKHENDIPLIENHTERKIRKARNHIDLSKLYKTYRKKHHKLHRRSIAMSNDYFRRFKELEQGLEKKLDDLNENMKKSNREYDNMLRKGTKDLLQIKEEDQVVKQRIELVNDLLKWMKELASEITNVEDKKRNVPF